MKKLLRNLVAIALCVAALVGCQSDVETIDSQVGASSKVFSVSIAETSRTYLGDKSGDNIYPVYWSEGDCIVVNGVKSQEAQINATNEGSASFCVNGVLNAPYTITYPYCSTTTASAPKVVFPVEQHYVENTIATDSAPMCGYALTDGEKVHLKHLAGILRLPITTNESGIELERVVITSSTSKIAGEFAVDCTSGALTAGASAGNVVTYLLPDDFTLSTSKESLFYITLPAVNTGECTIEFVERAGGKMVAKWSNKSIKSGIVREFKTIEYKRGAVCSLQPLEVEEDELIPAYPEIIGYVKDTEGNPIENVVVSDGFVCVATDRNGRYSMTVSSSAWYVYISLPAEYEVPINEYGQPGFFQKLESRNSLYNFTLKPLAGGKEKKFALFAFGDPQVTNTTSLTRFNTEAVPGIKKHTDEVRATGMNCYGITLGDIISNGPTNNDESFRDDMRDGFHASKTGLPVFQVMGNHDHAHCDASNPIFTDSKSPTINLRAQRNFENIFGPVNYSFNRGDVHIIGMKDIVYQSTTSGSDYTYGFTADQFEWLKQDLSFVPKDKAVVLCVHIQLLNRTDNYVGEALKLLNQYNDVHVISGHTHLIHNYEHSVNNLTTTKIYEHNAGALCGAWWCSNLCGDGVPNGYEVFIGGNDSKGGKFVNWYFIGYHEGMNTKSHQMRLYRGNAVTGGDISGSNTNGIKGYYGFNYADNVLLANIYNADSKWTVKVYEDGTYTGNMALITYKTPGYTSLIGDYTKANPRRAQDGVQSSLDMYVQGLFLGILGKGTSTTPSSGSWTGCRHMYKYTLKNKNAKVIKVEATDRFGNVYTETKITEGTDYSLVYNN